MPPSRKPTSLGIPAPVPPAPTIPLRHKPPTLDMETPPTIDQSLVEHTAIDDEEMQQKFVPVPDADAAAEADAVEPRWEESSTVAEKSSSRRGLPPLEPNARAGSSPIVASPDTPVPPSSRDDSARVLVDFDDSRVGGPTNVDDNAVASMPTAINPSASGPPSPVGLNGLGEGRLVVIGGNDRGREFALTARETSLGRGADNDIILTDIAVSRRHIVLFADGTRYGVRDLSSGNGTLINGVRIAGDVFVHDGDQLELGNTLLRFEQADVFSSVGAPPAQPAAGVVLGAGMVPIGIPGVLGMSSLPLPGVSPPGGRLGAPLTAPFVGRASALGSALPLSPQVFAPAGGEVPAPQPHPQPVPDASLGDFVPVQPTLGPQHPSALAMDLFKSQRNLLLYLAAGAAGFALLVWIVVRVSTRSDKQHSVVSTEASTSPALNALLADVDKPEPPRPVATSATSPTPALGVATLQAPAPAPVPVLTPTPAPAPVAAATRPAPAPPATKLTPRPKPVPRPVAVRRPAPAAKPSPTLSAERSASVYYRDRDFGRASDILHVAATKESGANADRLESMAKDYAQIGTLLARGDASAGGNPTIAMAAYKLAFQLDARSGKGAHAPYLKTQLGKVLPKAASAFMSAGKFEQARNACDDARQFGGAADPTIGKVRSMLEGKARELYTQGTTLARNKPEEAKSLWRRVLKMVPAESPWYSKSYGALNKSAKAAAQDEDE